MIDKTLEPMIKTLHTGRYFINLSEDIEELSEENNAADDYIIEIDDDEWGNDF